jgi:hypothetical protein
MIRITSKREGFRRCGVAHSATPTDWPADRWSPEQRARLQAEPMLIVVESPADASEATTETAAPVKKVTRK